jgi:membrane protease YdiL (CAAX protease family)
LPETDQPETRGAHPPESAERPDAPSVAPGEGFTAPVLPSSPRFSLREIFFGSDGLRAGWSLLLYVALLAALLTGCRFLVYSSRHHAAVAQPNAAAQSKPQSSKPSAPAASVPLPAKAVLLGDGTALLSVLIATWLMAKIERRPNSAYGLGGKRRLRNLLSGLAWGVALLSLLVFSLRGCGLLVFDARLLFGDNALRFAALWLSGFLLVGLFEETFFRGYLQFTLARGINGIHDWLRSFAAHATECGASGCNQTAPRASGLRATTQSAPGFWIAALLLSFGFGFSHRTNLGESPIGLVAAALIAVVFCLSLWRTGSLWWAIGFHAAWDWAQSFLYGVADSGMMVQGHLFATHPAGRVLLSGGLTGPEGSLFILPIVAATAAVIVLTLPNVHPDDPISTTHTRTTAGLDLP